MHLTDPTLTSIAQWSGGEGWRLSLVHDLPCHALVYVTRGQGRLLLQGAMHGVGPNNVIYLPADTLFSLDLGRQGMGHVALIPPGSDITMPARACHLRLRDVSEIGTLTALFDAGLRELADARPLAQEALAAHFILLSVWLRRQLARQEHLPAKQSAAARLTARLFERIAAARFPETIIEHAAALGVTPTHLSRAAKSATGLTAADLVAERNLHAARLALADTTVPINDIARHLGFGTAAYFTRFIRKRTGQTPSRLRANSARKEI